MKSFLFSLSLLIGLALNALAGVDLGSSTSRTPYDSYMYPVKQVLSSLNGDAPTMERVRELMRQGRNFRYSFTEPYVAATPEVTEAKRAGDCKAKALWLCDKMGDENVRFVVGKSRRSSSMSHAWVLWKDSEGKWWVLDPTNTSMPIAADRLSSNEYIPLYTWKKGATLAHAETDAYLNKIAGKRSKAPVARRG